MFAKYVSSPTPSFAYDNQDFFDWPTAEFREVEVDDMWSYSSFNFGSSADWIENRRVHLPGTHRTEKFCATFYWTLSGFYCQGIVYDYNQKKMRFFQLGCEHSWQTTNLGNSYSRYVCKNCDKVYDVDSSD